MTDPSSEFDGNQLCSFCEILLTNQPTNDGVVTNVMWCDDVFLHW